MLKPLADHIIVELTVKEEKTSSGIYLPDTASKEKPQTGKVVAVGAGKGLIRCSGNLVPFENSFPKNTKLYRLMTTKPGEC